MVTTRQDLAPASIVRSMTDGAGSKALGILFHETANKSRGANAAAHARLQKRGNVRNASWNWTVDDTEAVQSFPNGIKTWSAGRGGLHYVSVELCVNPDGDYAQTVQNGIELAWWLRSQGVGDALKNHHDITGKNCPTQLLSGAEGGWAGFVARINGASTPARPAPSSSSGKLGEDGFEGSGTLGAMQRALGSANPDGTLSAPSNFTRALQRFLNARGFRDYDGRVLEVDGFGHRQNVPSAVIARTRTDWAFQQYLETTPTGRARGYVGDGEWGRPSAGVKVIQAELNAGRLFR
ncbi:N-acetylmuramoyl-L-alanine amidase [Cellulosimicrobium sp. XJ-DQ-B-000]|uniref:peptidoglycan recognition protein family protein n=1 Tax=Cellulosimicrobium sp. XJ-DQ-B-000 TaxID=3072182 RepID=UPI002809AD31|nr:N-acetylmuramoyl-L-alanine amidase [Cellulosimicrobium sp. XJ-DQ-B-000]MDQ8040528.1 N-acetylmuramoyl-L-alanine amidase [Cellulosimicrobium sp. XJ-DQ-B-000]